MNKTLKEILSEINERSIRTKEELVKNETLYADFFIELDNFIIKNAFQTGTNKRLLFILNEIGFSTEDARYDVLEHCINKLDQILAVKESGQISYCHTIITNKLKDICRKELAIISKTVSLNEILDCHDDTSDSKNAKTLEDYIEDPSANIEDKYLTKEIILDLYSKFSNNADSLICYIATKILGYKNKELTNLLMATGSVGETLNVLNNNLYDIFGITEDELPPVKFKSSGLSVDLSQKKINSKNVSGKVNNIIYRMK